MRSLQQKFQLNSRTLRNLLQLSKLSMKITLDLMLLRKLKMLAKRDSRLDGYVQGKKNRMVSRSIIKQDSLSKDLWKRIIQGVIAQLLLRKV